MIRVQNEYTGEINISQGVRQGCVMTPLLYNLYTNQIFHQIEHPNVNVTGGHNINNLRYVDDTMLLAESPEELEALLTAVNTTEVG